ncbi:glycine receptor subunit alpha-3-like [Branchiostoma lanceolatum]|uniref:glycine receptor subunit alpha-3-like n=1 Tax=Branchiostoma lanceolatum TaxID=7740 RepID=UPI0034542F5B
MHSMRDFYKILETYDMRIRPNDQGPGVHVLMQMYVESIASISEISMEYVITFYFRMWWNDPRFKFTPTQANQTAQLHVAARSLVWTPDIYFLNEKDAGFRASSAFTSLMWVWPNGDILSSEKKTLKNSCPMDFRQYPFDAQFCKIQLGPYGMTTDDLIIEWKEPAVEMNPGIELPEYVIDGWTWTSCGGNYSIGEFGCNQATFKMVRSIGYYITQTYVPSALIVALSWLTFWISPLQAPARVALGITTVLTSTTLTSATRSSIPRFSYIRAIDIWMLVCTIYVFTALVEFAAAHHFSRRKQESMISKQMNKNKDAFQPNGVLKVHPFSNGKDAAEDQKEREKKEATVEEDFDEDVAQAMADSDERGQIIAAKIDLASKIFFPATFILFNIIYWAVYMGSYEGKV